MRAYKLVSEPRLHLTPSVEAGFFLALNPLNGYDLVRRRNDALLLISLLPLLSPFLGAGFFFDSGRRIAIIEALER